MKVKLQKIDSNLLIGHLDTDLSPSDPSFEHKIYQFSAFDRNGNLLEGISTGNPDSHGSLTSRIIFDDALYAFPPLQPNAKLAAVSVPTRGKTLLNILKGMDILLGIQPRIACMPIGFRKQTPIFYPMIRAFLEKGILPVLPIGNGGAGIAHVPGCYPGVLSVGALDAHGQVAGFSGSLLDDAGRCLKPDLLAPGSSHSAPGQRSQNGTSFACAYVAGVAARLMQARPEAGAEAVRQALLATTRPLAAGQSNRCQRGVVQPKAALEYLLRTGNTIPSPPEDSIPSFLLEPYRDGRFLFQYKYAKPELLIEAIVIPYPGIEKSGDSQSPSPVSRELFSQTQKTTGLAPDYSHYFIQADMAYIQARPAFFEALLKNPGLFAISAVDVNIFEM